jgi:hypothetical protein
MYANLFVDPNQTEIIILDDGNNQRYSYKLHFSKTKPNKISIGKGWRNYVKANDLKPYNTLMYVLDKPTNSVHVSIVDKS